MSNASGMRHVGALAGALGLVVIIVSSAQLTAGAQGTWATMKLAAHGSNVYLRATSCPTTKFCMAVGQVSYKLGTTTFIEPVAERWNGTSWSGSTQLNQGGREAIPDVGSGVSCTSSTFCMTVGTNFTSQIGFAEKWNGFGWSKLAAPPSTSGLGGVSCVSSTYCVALANLSSPAGQATTEIWNGKAWSLQALPSGAVTPSALSCVSTSFCMAVGTDLSGSYVWNGHIWSTVSAADPFISVSCVSATDCEAAAVVNGLNGTVSFEGWNGTTWQAQPESGDLLWNFYYQTSCASASFCVAFGATENESTTGVPTLASALWNGVSWSNISPPSLGTSSDFFGGACPSVSLCVGVGTSSPTGEIAEEYAGS